MESQFIDKLKGKWEKELVEVSPHHLKRSTNEIFRQY